MKAWTNDECDALRQSVLASMEFNNDDPAWEQERQIEQALIRAAVDEARREEREACAAEARLAKYGASMPVADRTPSMETQNFAADWGDAITERIVAAILARSDVKP